jgi:ATP-dependent protease ClpP protease subunit
MSRSKIALSAAALAAPQATESPYKGEFKAREWFRFDNSAGDTTHVYIYDMIGGWFGVTAQEFIDQLKEVDTKTITLHINSPGGSVFEATAIYNALLGHSASVNVEIDALAASAASFIAQAGDTVTMNRGSMMMIHDASAGSYENAKGHRETADILDKLSNSIASIYAARAGGTDAEWRAVMKEEAWYTAQEAVDNGLADKVGEKKATEDPADKWDLSIFNFAGRGYAPSPAAVMTKAKKETQVGADPKNTEKATEGEQGSEEQEHEEQSAEVEETEEEKAAREAKEAEDAEKANKPEVENRAGTTFFMLNGERVSDPAKVQAYINGLEGFKTETVAANRKAFVEQLAHDNKIAASQIEDLIEFAQGLSTDQYTAWSKTWSAAPANSAFAKHGQGGNAGGSGEPTKLSPQDQKLQDAKEIVAHMRASGMKEEQLKATASYKLLEANNAL